MVDFSAPGELAQRFGRQGPYTRISKYNTKMNTGELHAPGRLSIASLLVAPGLLSLVVGVILCSATHSREERDDHRRRWYYQRNIARIHASEPGTRMRNMYCTRTSVAYRSIA